MTFRTRKQHFAAILAFAGGLACCTPAPTQAPAQDPKPRATDADGIPRSQSREPAYLGHITLMVRDPDTGDLGLIRVSNFPGSAAGSIAWSANGIAAVGAKPDSTWAARALALVGEGQTAEAAIAAVIDGERTAHIRQLAVLTADGKGHVHSGDAVLSKAETVVQPDFVFFSALMLPMAIRRAMEEAYRDAAALPMAERLFAAIDAGTSLVEEGGKAPGGLGRTHPVISAQLVVVRKGGSHDGRGDTLADLRVDYDRDPVERLKLAYQAFGQHVLGQRLLQMQRDIEDTASARYRANRLWIERIGARREVGKR